MMGGGFGGCTINIVHNDAVEDLFEKLRLAYLKEMNQHLTIYKVVAGEGARVLG